MSDKTELSNEYLKMEIEDLQKENKKLKLILDRVIYCLEGIYTNTENNGDYIEVTFCTENPLESDNGWKSLQSNLMTLRNELNDDK